MKTFNFKLSHILLFLLVGFYFTSCEKDTSNSIIDRNESKLYEFIVSNSFELEFDDTLLQENEKIRMIQTRIHKQEFHHFNLVPNPIESNKVFAYVFFTNNSIDNKVLKKNIIGASIYYLDSNNKSRQDLYDISGNLILSCNVAGIYQESLLYFNKQLNNNKTSLNPTITTIINKSFDTSQIIWQNEPTLFRSNKHIGLRRPDCGSCDPSGVDHCNTFTLMCG